MFRDPRHEHDACPLPSPTMRRSYHEGSSPPIVSANDVEIQEAAVEDSHLETGCTFDLESKSSSVALRHESLDRDNTRDSSVSDPYKLMSV